MFLQRRSDTSTKLYLCANSFNSFYYPKNSVRIKRSFYGLSQVRLSFA